MKESSVQSYEPVIGLEVHCQLATNAKTFSPESAAFGAEPNTNVDPVSLGHPGTLPVLNERVLDFTIRMGLATHCSIRPRSTFARKHYFYPDLPKGYQISQYEDPICHDGWLDVEVEEGAERSHCRIGITRIHLEEDAGKSIHDHDPQATLLDFNRCGVPLMEIVTEPDLRSPREAAVFLQSIRQIVRYLGICDGNMEEGSLRCDANVSVRPAGQDVLGTKTEVKNMNSFKNVENALRFEIKRQVEILESGERVVQETRLWDADAGATRSMRSKEEAHDYRYFPDPDLVPVVVSEKMLQAARTSLPDLPDARRTRLVRSLGLPEYDADILTEEREMADYFDEVHAAVISAEVADSSTVAKQVSNFLMSDVLRVVNEKGITMDAFPIDAVRLARLIELRIEDRISSTAASELFDLMLEQPDDPIRIAQARNLLQVSDEDALQPVVHQVLDNNPSQVDQFLGGKEGVMGFLIGQVMRTFDGSPDPRRVRKLLVSELERRRKR
jgi:aspartyl-tRNA(Asn)/glutamyl-tRNA(Gln) amidotransferase subunit B